MWVKSVLVSTGDTRRCQLAIYFCVLKKQGETWNQRSSKRVGKEIEDTSRTVVTNQSSTATITDETVIENF